MVCFPASSAESTFDPTKSEFSQPPNIEKLSRAKGLSLDKYKEHFKLLNGLVIKFRSSTGRIFSLSSDDRNNPLFIENDAVIGRIVPATRTYVKYPNLKFHCIEFVDIALNDCHAAIVSLVEFNAPQIVYYSKDGKPVFWSITKLPELFVK